MTLRSSFKTASTIPAAERPTAKLVASFGRGADTSRGGDGEEDRPAPVEVVDAVGVRG
jgi:hypothetical protein